MADQFVIDEETGAAHEDLSRTSRDFLEFVRARPECLSRESFALLDQPDAFRPFPLQSWPVFLGSGRAAEMRRVSRALYQLVTSVPERFFGNDAARIAEAYGMKAKTAAKVSGALEKLRHTGGALGRGDFILSESGLKCIEFNMSASLGGWQSSQWARIYRSIPLVEEFVATQGVELSCTDSAHVFLTHAIEEGVKASLPRDGCLNIAFVVPPEKQVGEAIYRLGKEKYRALLSAAGSLTGEIMACEYPDLAESAGELSLRGRPVHIVVEGFGGVMTEAVYRSVMAGRTKVYNGPPTMILGSKLNLAYLSENEDSDLLDDEERGTVRLHIPWSRHLRAAETTYRGKRVDLCDFVLAERERLVLKPSWAFGGSGVRIGAHTAPELWAEAVGEALREGYWIVQERVVSRPYLFQSGAHGCEPHDLAWGIFVFGGKAGGGFLRMLPKNAGGVVNSAAGATEGVIFEVEKGP